MLVLAVTEALGSSSEPADNWTIKKDQYVSLALFLSCLSAVLKLNYYHNPQLTVDTGLSQFKPNFFSTWDW